MESGIIEILASYSGAVTTEVIQRNDALLKSAAESTAGFASALVRIIQDSSLSRGIRQRAVSALRNLVVVPLWPLSSDGSSALSPEERSEVRAALPASLSDRDGRVRCGAADVLSCIAREDWPVEWPEVLEALMGCCAAPLAEVAGGMGEEEQVGLWVTADGALTALLGFVGTVSNRHVPQLAQEVLPVLTRLASADGSEASAALAMTAFGLDLRLKAMKIMLDLLDSLESAGHDQPLAASVHEVMDANFSNLLAVTAQILSTEGWGSRVCALKISALRVVNLLIVSFPAALKPVVTPVVSALMSLLDTTLQAFRSMELDDVDTPASAAGTSTDGVVPGILDSYAGEDPEAAPSLVLAQLITILQSLLLSPKKFMRKSVDPYAPHLGCILLSSCQLSETILAEWADDSAAFFRDEVDEYSAGVNLRQDAAGLVKDVVDIYGVNGLECILEACMTALSGTPPNSDFCCLSGQRWKVFESAIYLVGCCRLYLVRPERIPHKKKHGAPSFSFDISTFVNHLITLLNGNGAAAFDDEPPEIRLVCAPYIVGRSLWCASCLAHAATVTDEACEQLLSASVEGLQPDYTIPIRTMACKSLTRLVKRLRGERLEKVAPLIFDRLTTMIMNAIKVTSDELDVDETASEFITLLVQTCAYARQAAAAHQAALTDLLLHLWCRKGTHMLLAPSLAAGLECMVNLEDAAAAGAAMSIQLPVLTAYLEVALADAQQISPLPDILLPDGAHLPVAMLDTTLKGVPELGAMSAAAIDIVVAILRRTREMVVTVGASSPYLTCPAELLPALDSIVQLAQHSLDHKVIGCALATLTAAVRLCGPNIPAEGSVFSVSNILAAAARVLTCTDDIPDDAAGNVAPLVTALQSHCGIADFSAMVLPALIARLAQSGLPSFVLRVCHAVAHCVICDFDKALQVLEETMVPLPPSGFLSNIGNPGPHHDQQPGLILYLRAVAKFMDVISSPISKQVILHAISRVLTRPDALEMISDVLVPSSTSAESLDDDDGKPRTRSKAAGRREIAPVSLSVRLLSLVIKSWVDAIYEEPEDAGDEDTDENDDSDASSAVEEAHTSKPRRSPFVPASNVEDIIDGEMAYKHKKGKKYSDPSDEEMMLLADLLGGGDAMGGGKTIADILASGHYIGDDSDSDDDADELGLDIDKEAASEDLAEIAVWDEPPVPSEEGTKYAPLSHDPVISHFVHIDDEGYVTTQPAVGEMTGFIVLLARASMQMPDSHAAALVTATMSELGEVERALLQERILPLAARAP